MIHCYNKSLQLQVYYRFINVRGQFHLQAPIKYLDAQMTDP